MALSSIETRYSAYLQRIAPLLKRQGMAILKEKEWGMNETPRAVLENVMLLETSLWLREWKAYQQNTFHTTYDAKGCPQFTYPSNLAENDIFANCTYTNAKDKDCCTCHTPVKEHGGGYIGLFNCCHIDIRPALVAWGVYPLGARPDGIDYMQIERSRECCFPNIFQINKIRNHAE